MSGQLGYGSAGFNATDMARTLADSKIEGRYTPTLSEVEGFDFRFGSKTTSNMPRRSSYSSRAVSDVDKAGARKGQQG
jgi:hypothetical protein